MLDFLCGCWLCWPSTNLTSGFFAELSRFSLDYIKILSLYLKCRNSWISTNWPLFSSIRNNKPSRRHFWLVGLWSTCIQGLGQCACISHMYIMRVPSIMADRKRMSYISCWASYSCRTRHLASASLRSFFEVLFEQRSRGAWFSRHVEGSTYNRIKRWIWGVCMSPTGNCSRHGCVEGEEDGTSRTINREGV